MSTPKALFTPLKVGNKTVKNRITMAALTRNRAENTYPTQLMKEHYVQRAGAGLLVTEATLVTRQGYVFCTVLFTPLNAFMIRVEPSGPTLLESGTVSMSSRGKILPKRSTKREA